ncbi:MAG: acyl carrier protein phosphodiesterase [Thermoanaerobaculia bacterium]
MNHLAHLFLARDEPVVVLGNLAGDFVHGRLGGRFDPRLEEGIRMHRRVDSFTDSHAVVGRSRRRFPERWKHTTRILVDVFYDRLFYEEWNRFSDADFDSFRTTRYRQLEEALDLASEPLRGYLPLMIRDDFLASCTTDERLARTLRRIASRLRGDWPLEEALPDFLRLHDELRVDFLEFFPELLKETGSPLPGRM